jgi:hypothetical protein
MTRTRTAWLALSLLASVSTAAVITASLWRAPATVDAPPDQKIVQAESADAILPKAPNWPEVSAREVINPDPPIALHAEPPAALSPADAETAAAETIVNITSRHWHDANAETRSTVVDPQQIKKPKDSKAEMRGKRSKAAANAKACTPSNGFAGFLQKLNLSPRCPT